MKTKRLFDLFFAISAILILGWILLIAWVLAAADTRSNGMFFQERIGQFGKVFQVFKLKTMRNEHDFQSISTIGKTLRKWKLDEFPQFFNILFGQMSVVGPRPDIAGYYDKLDGENKQILNLKPGLTSEAALKYFDEETFLELQQNPLEYNDTVIFPDKVRMNLQYLKHQSFFGDLKIIFKTFWR